MRITHLLRVGCGFLFTALWFVCVAMAQTETATVSGLITDETGGVVPGAEVKLQSVDRGTVATATTNDAGIYVFASVHPGQYQVTVHKPGFKQVDLLGMIVNVQDHIEQNFRLQIGSVAESVTVNANDMHLNTTDATVSTVVDRQFAENLPMNGRSFQTLIQLTPGVVLTQSTNYEAGQFSVNGQRASSNYWMVDGVSANIGTAAAATLIPGNGFGGALGSFSAQGGTNSLVSVDALQEFRILTSTYAPEFGRTPGGQISIVTRSGTNQFHGTAFDYLRNDVFDANNWFNTAVTPPLPKAEERQNDFGGTFGGPILKDKTFFFFSYEGLRLRLPQTTLSTVPDAGFTPGGTTNSRQNATPAMQPYLNAFPLPNPSSPEIYAPCTPNVNGCPSSGQQATGAAHFNASYSDPATLDAYSIRVDHKVGRKLNVFGRYNYSPSENIQRDGGNNSLSTLVSSRITTQTATTGATWSMSPVGTNDFRFNYSRVNADSLNRLDSFGGAVPFSTLPFPSPYNSQNAFLFFAVLGLEKPLLFVGKNLGTLQQQSNIVDNLSLQKSSHTLKFGVDFRRLSPLYAPFAYAQQDYFLGVSRAESGNLLLHITRSARSATILFRNFGLFAQDTWRIVPRLTLTYGLRWDMDFAPSSLSGPSLLAVTGFNLNNLSNLALAPPGTPVFSTAYGNVAPRLGIAYQLNQNPEWQTVIRGGFGVFYDLASQQVGNGFQQSYPFGASNLVFGGTFPLDPATAPPPPITAASLASGTLFSFDPNLKLPYTLEWNIAFEQALGKQQTISASYIGSVGRRLLQSPNINSPNPNFSAAILVTNAGTSDYNALQLQFQRRLSHGLQALASYFWAHSIDTASAGSSGVPGSFASANRGSSDFDIRHAFSAGVTYDLPTPKINALTNVILRGWSLQNVIQARSAPPVDIFYGFLPSHLSNGFLTAIRPDVVPGQTFYVFGSQYPGGKGFNPAAFAAPPTDPNTGVPLRQGNLGRNALRGFGATQWDFAVHRDFPIRESLKLQFRAEMFNVLNHPNFGPPIGDLQSPQAVNPQFGQSVQMLGQSLNNGNLGGGALSPLYQIGGPRSIQLALKLFF